MTTDPLNGMWSTPSRQFPPEYDFSIFFPDALRIVSVFVISASPLKRVAVCYWYERESPQSIRVRLKPDGEWSSHTYELQDATHYWTRYGRDYPWQRVPPHDEPEWLKAMVINASKRMDGLEMHLPQTKKAEQSDAVNPHAFGTFGTSAAEQPLVPKAGGDT